MAEHTPTDDEHADGSWFLEAVGVKKPAPSSIESIAELERENTVPDLPAMAADDAIAEAVPPETDDPSTVDEKTVNGEVPDQPAVLSDEDPEHHEGIVIEMTSFDGDPGTSLSTFDAVPEPPPLPSNVAIAIPRERSDPPDVLSTTVDEYAIAPPVETRRPFRWPAFGLALLVVAAIVLAILWLPRAANSAAAATRDSYYQASLTVREFLPTAQASLDVVTRSSSTDAALGTVIPVVSELDTHATNLAAVAAEPLPSTLPLVTPSAIAELPPLQDRSAILATDASEVARQLGHAYVYRTSITDLLVVGDLPTSAETEEINALSVTLATSLAENASLIAELPSNTSFDDVAASAADAVGAYAKWQDDYLSALVDGDTAEATTLIADIEDIRAGLIAETEQALVSFRNVLDDRILSLSIEFDDHLDELNQ